MTNDLINVVQVATSCQRLKDVSGASLDNKGYLGKSVRGQEGNNDPLF